MTFCSVNDSCKLFYRYGMLTYSTITSKQIYFFNKSLISTIVGLFCKCKQLIWTSTNYTDVPARPESARGRASSEVAIEMGKF